MFDYLVRGSSPTHHPESYQYFLDLYTLLWSHLLRCMRLMSGMGEQSLSEARVDGKSSSTFIGVGR